MNFREVNFDGLVGPTHNYAGLSLGNVASTVNGGSVANPREAALQGLDKMLALAERGHAQAVLPPLRRPNLELLRAVGFGDAVTAAASLGPAVEAFFSREQGVMIMSDDETLQANRLRLLQRVVDVTAPLGDLSQLQV